MDDTMKLYELYILEINKLLHKYKNNILLVKYEDIILNSDKTLSEIYNFCKMNFDNIDLPESIFQNRVYAYKKENMDMTKYAEKIKSYGY